MFDYFLILCFINLVFRKSFSLVLFQIFDDLAKNLKITKDMRLNLIHSLLRHRLSVYMRIKINNFFSLYDFQLLILTVLFVY